MNNSFTRQSQPRHSQPRQSEPRQSSITRRSFFTSAATFSAALLCYRPLSAFAADTTGPVTLIEFGPDGKKTGKVSVPRVVKTDDEWKQQLSPRSYLITRKAATEPAYSGSTWNLHDHGIYHCVCCDTALFSSETKFESGTGWPSFWQPIARENIVETKDRSDGMVRTAVSCRRCDAHLGHVFADGPPPTGMRYCMNSEAMHFVKLA